MSIEGVYSGQPPEAHAALQPLISLDEVTDASQLLLPHFKDILNRDPSADAKITALFNKPASVALFRVTPSLALSILQHAGLPIVFKHVTDPTPPLMTIVREAAAIMKANGEEHADYLDKLQEMEAELTANPQNVNETSEFEVTILHVAACSKMKKMVELILRFKPNTRDVNCFQQTAAARSRNMGFTEIADIIDNYTRSKP